MIDFPLLTVYIITSQQGVVNFIMQLLPQTHKMQMLHPRLLILLQLVQLI